MTRRGAPSLAVALLLVLTAQAATLAICELACLFAPIDRAVVALEGAPGCHGSSGAVDAATIGSETPACQHPFELAPAPLQRVRSAEEATTVTANVAGAVRFTTTRRTLPAADSTLDPGSSGRSLPLRL